MAHYNKYKRTDVGGLTAHYERAKDSQGKYIKFHNQDIDLSKAYLNYNLAPLHEGGQRTFINQRLSEVSCAKRKDLNTMCSWVVTAPKSIVDSGSEKQFFQDTYDFLSNRYGKENVVSAYVHMDEKTPHIHFAFVPVVKDKKKGHLKVSANDCVTRIDLQKFHDDLDKHLVRTMGSAYDGGVLNEATKEGNRSIAELKRGTAVQELKELEARVVALGSELASLHDVETIVGNTRIVPLANYVALKKADFDKLADMARSLPIAVREAETLAAKNKALTAEERKLADKVRLLTIEAREMKYDHASELREKGRELDRCVDAMVHGDFWVSSDVSADSDLGEKLVNLGCERYRDRLYTIDPMVSYNAQRALKEHEKQRGKEAWRRVELERRMKEQMPVALHVARHVKAADYRVALINRGKEQSRIQTPAPVQPRSPISKGKPLGKPSPAKQSNDFDFGM